MKKFKHHLKDILSIGFSLILVVSLIAYPSNISQSTLTGINYCIKILVPSLFPFMFLSRFIASQGLPQFMKKPLNYITKTIFYLPGAAAPAIILSLIGGYPVGASSAAVLISQKEINNEQLQRLMCFTVNAGPAFIVSVVGCSLLKNPFLGYLMLIVQIFVSLSTGIILGIISRIKKQPFYVKRSSNPSKINFSESLISATSQASESIIMMCGLIIVFTDFISILKSLKVFELISSLCTRTNVKPESLISLLLSFFEVTGACLYSVKNYACIPLISFILAYGGVCTHLQIISILKNFKMNYNQFHLFRILNGIFSSLIVYLLLSFFETSAPVFISTVETCQAGNSTSIPGSIALIFLCLFLTMSIKKTGT